MIRSRKDLAMMAVIGGLLAFAVFNFVFKPQGKELSSTRSDLRSVESQISEAEADLLAPLETTPVADDGVLARAIPEDPAFTQLLRQLEGLADQTNVTLETITPGQLEANPNGPGGSMVLEITASGSHDANEVFVNGLKSVERLLVIDRIALIPPLPVVGQPIEPEQLQLSVRAFALRAPVEPVTETPTSVP